MEDKVKELFDNFDMNKIKSGLGDLMTKVNPMLEKLMKETEKLTKPKAKKNINYNGKQISLSLVEDGRLILSFSTLDEATIAYEDAISLEDKHNYLSRIDTIKQTSEFHREEGLKMSNKYSDLLTKYNLELKKTWWDKLLGR